MTQKKTIRVRAVGDKLLSRIDADGMLVQGRYVGRGRNREATAEGEEVPATSYYHRAIERGDIELVKETDQ